MGAGVGWGVEVAAGGGAVMGYGGGVGVSVGVGTICRVGAGVGVPPEQAVASATGRTANRAIASSALFNNDRMLFMGLLYIPFRLLTVSFRQ